MLSEVAASDSFDFPEFLDRKCRMAPAFVFEISTNFPADSPRWLAGGDLKELSVLRSNKSIVHFENCKISKYLNEYSLLQQSYEMPYVSSRSRKIRFAGKTATFTSEELQHHQNQNIY